MRWSLGVLTVVVVSACSMGGKEAKPPPPPPAMPLVGVSCEEQLVGLDGDVAVALEPLAAKRQEIDRKRKQVAGPLRKLRKALAVVRSAEGRLEEFDAAHPGRYLPSDLYSYWTGLRDDYNGAVDEYNRLLRKFRPHQREIKALLREARGLWKDVRKANRTYEDERDGCLGPTPDVEGREAERIRRLELFAAKLGDEIAERSMLVECDRVESWEAREAEAKGKADLLGYVRVGSRVAHLAPEVCYAMHRILYLNWEPDFSCIPASREARVPLCAPRVREAITAFATLAHEAQHVKGETNEKRAECFGLQHTALVAQGLDVPPSVSNQVAWYARRFWTVPKSYRSDECRDGGRLDLDDASTSFP